MAIAGTDLHIVLSRRKSPIFACPLPGVNYSALRQTLTWLSLTNALSLSVEHKPQTTSLHQALSCAAASIFLHHQLYLKPAVCK